MGMPMRDDGVIDEIDDILYIVHGECLSAWINILNVSIDLSYRIVCMRLYLVHYKPSWLARYQHVYSPSLYFFPHLRLVNDHTHNSRACECQLLIFGGTPRFLDPHQ